MEKSKNYNSKKYHQYKLKNTDVITWVSGGDTLIGEHVFTFDNVHFFEFWADYPDNLTPEQKKIFDKERPGLAELKDENVICPDDDEDNEDE